MKEIRAEFIGSIERTHNVKSFRFKIDSKIEFSPGQFLQFIFDEKDPKNKALNKYLSFSSSPDKNYFEVTKKISESEFSRKLLLLKEGDTVLFKMPFGSCSFNENYKKIGFLVGGIGITPAISIIEYIVERKIDTDVVLIYANWTTADIAFKEEIDSWSKNNENIKVTHVLANEEVRKEGFRKGFIDEKLLRDLIGDLIQRVIFIYGPPVMVNSVKDLCVKLNYKSEQIKAETFVGY